MRRAALATVVIGILAVPLVDRLGAHGVPRSVGAALVLVGVIAIARRVQDDGDSSVAVPVSATDT